MKSYYNPIKDLKSKNIPWIVENSEYLNDPHCIINQKPAINRAESQTCSAKE